MTLESRKTHVVVKVGGSLFRQRELLDRAVGFINSNIQRSLVIICGGGQLADVIREMDAELQLGDSLAHDLAVQTMRLNLSILISRFEQPLVASSIDEIGSLANGKSPVFFEVKHWQQTAEIGAHNWETTSDSMAAALAIESWASELVLLKADSPDMKDAPENVFQSEMVDRSFANLCSDIPAIRIVSVGNTKPDWLWVNEKLSSRSIAAVHGQ